MGAKVIAAGRSIDTLEKIAKIHKGKVEVVQLKGDMGIDAQKLGSSCKVDAYLDFYPAAASKSTHLMNCLLALEIGGRACFMGGIQEAVSIPYGLLMFKSLKLMDKFMYERHAVARLVKMIENGTLKLRKDAELTVAGSYGLGKWEKAFGEAEKNCGWGVQGLMVPQKH